MSIAELIPQKYEFDFGDLRLCLRYDITALFRLEREGLAYQDIFKETTTGAELAEFLRAGMSEDVGAERAAKMLKAIGAQKVWEHCRNAVLLSLPEYDPTIIPKNEPQGDGTVDFARLRTLICDIMGKDEQFFWNSTLRELLARWQDYAIVKGYAEPPERMLMYDTEGME